MRIAVTQFSTSKQLSDNLDSCCRVINKAATCQPSLIVLPEFCNTSPCYIDKDHAWDEALAIDGIFLKEIAALANKYNCYILINVTLRRNSSNALLNNERFNINEQNITISSCLFSSSGELVAVSDKSNLSCEEQKFFVSSNAAIDTITTTQGVFGCLIGNDSFTFKTSRDLALSGVQLICNSINSSVLDQVDLHDPARAFENNVFFATANKVGCFNLSEQKACGQSQIVSPEGRILARMNNLEEGFVFADILLNEVGLNNKVRPDGTDVTKYQLAEHNLKLTVDKNRVQIIENIELNIANTANVAIFATYNSNEKAIEDVCHYIENNLSDIIQLPELFFIADKTITNNEESRVHLSQLSEKVIEQVSSSLGPFQYVCTSLIIDGKHQAVLINEHGLLATQPQLNYCKRYEWTTLGHQLNIVELPLEQGSVRIAMLTADDANSPEVVRCASLNNIQVLLVPFDIQESCEVEYSLISRAAENRICIIAASREKNFVNNLTKKSLNEKCPNKVKAEKSTGFIANLNSNLAFLPQWRKQKFNGFINKPIVKYQHGKITKAVIHPIAACRNNSNCEDEEKPN